MEKLKRNAWKLKGKHNYDKWEKNKVGNFLGQP